MSICPFPVLNMLCPRCKHKFKYNTFTSGIEEEIGLGRNSKTECPQCKLPFINTNYVRLKGQTGMIISDWGENIWAEEYDDGKWRIPEGKYIFDEEEEKIWGLSKEKN